MVYRLPPDTGDFTGRRGAITELTAILTAGEHVPVAAVTGMGGVGKTALAVRVAHAMRWRFPAGRLYVDLRGTGGRPASPREVLGGLLETLGTPDVPYGLDERAALYRSELAGRRFLVLLDDALSPAQVRPLLPGAVGSAALVTSRNTMAGLPGAWHVDLDVLEPDESMALLACVAGADRVAAERGAALDLVAACGFLPLAIREAGARIAAPAYGQGRDAVLGSVGRLACRLSRGLLEDLPSVVARLRPAYDRLASEERRALRLLALADGPGFSAGAAGAALGLSHADDLLESLADRSLLECPAPNRYRFHQLIRAFALTRTGPPGERATALRALLGHYLTAGSARTWLFAEHDAMLSAIERAAAEPDGPLDAAATLLLTLVETLDPEWSPVRVREAALAVRAAACRRDEPAVLAKADRALGSPRVIQR